MENCDIIDQYQTRLIPCNTMLNELKSKKAAGSVGSGGFGDVYILENADYAIKVIKKRSEQSEQSESYSSEIHGLVVATKKKMNIHLLRRKKMEQVKKKFKMK